MATTILLHGECLVWKNNASAGKMYADFAYDHDLKFFKLLVSGNIQTSFNPAQVKGIQLQQVGSLIKRWQIGVWAKWPNGDEYTYVFTLPTRQAGDETKANIEAIIGYTKGLDEALRLLKARERATSSEIAAILKVDPSKDSRSVQEFVEGAISSGQVEGVYDGKEFVSRYALQRETIRYDVVTKFELDSSGVLVVSCPKCGAAIPLESKESNGKCRYCGSTFKIPRKLLDMV